MSHFFNFCSRCNEKSVEPLQVPEISSIALLPPPFLQVDTIHVILFVLKLTIDHTGSNSAEQKRIALEGGIIENGRVNGLLEPSRTIGDIDMKSKAMEGWVTARPDVNFFVWPSSPQQQTPKNLEEQHDSLYWEQEVEQSVSHEHMVVLATDGLWDVVSKYTLVDILRQVHQEEYCDQEGSSHLNCIDYQPFVTSAAARKMVQVATALGSTDDISVVVICF